MLILLCELYKIESIAEFYGQNSAFPKLTPSESRLLDAFRSINDEGQDKLIDYAEDLVASGRYIKSSLIDVVENA